MGEGTHEPDAAWPNAACVILTAETAEQRDWTASTAIELARRLAEERSRVVVADLRPADRAIGRDLGLDDGAEGIVDVLFRGVSFARAARKPHGESFYYLGLGAEPPSRDELLGDARWERIARRFRDADAHLLLLIPASDWREAAPVPGFDGVILLNAAAELVEAESGTAASGSGAGPNGSSFTRRLPRDRGPLVAVAAVVAVLVAGILWAIGTRDLTPSAESVEAAASGIAMSRSGGSAAEANANLALPYSVLIASYSSYDDALARGREWDRPSVPFYVAPTVVRGVVYYRVFAGLLPERDGAVELMRSLADEGIKDTERDWDVRPVRLAYDLGTFEDREAARDAVERLRARDIPGYMVGVAGSVAGGRAGFRVYAGGYEKPEDAVPLERRIAASDLKAELVERVGRIEP